MVDETKDNVDAYTAEADRAAAEQQQRDGTAYPRPPQPFQQPQPQDLHPAQLAGPDRAWSRTQPIQLTPSKERLDAKHQLVTIRNASDVEISATGRPKPQVHIVIDRHLVGHELQPGQSKHDIDMLVSEIEYFLRESKDGRVDGMGRLKPKHPVKIVGYKPEQVADDTPTNRRTKAA
jgi:hypothetical protein